MDASAAIITVRAQVRTCGVAGVHSKWARRLTVILCDLCGEEKECVQKEIDGRQFDLCTDCRRALEEKLRGKGRVKKTRDIVFLPPRTVLDPEESKTAPGLPLKILGGGQRTN